MAGHFLPWIDATTRGWTEFVLALPVVLWAGKPFFVRAIQSLIHLSPNMWTLIGLGTGAAFVYSVVATVALVLCSAVGVGALVLGTSGTGDQDTVATGANAAKSRERWRVS